MIKNLQCALLEVLPPRCNRLEGQRLFQFVGKHSSQAALPSSRGLHTVS